MSVGNIAPPTITMIIREEPSVVNGPRFRIPKANIVGHMMDMNKVVNQSDQMASHPDTVMATVSNNMLMIAYVSNRRFGAILCIRKPPEKRPNMSEIKP